MDRFAPPDEQAVVGQCALCHEEIYEGDNVRRTIYGDYVHSNFEDECAELYAVQHMYDAMGTINIRGEID